MKRSKWEMWKAQCLSNKIFDIVNLIFTCTVFLLCLYPLYYIVIISFSKEIVGTYLFPNGVSFEGYKMIFTTPDVWLGYANTIINTVLSVVCSLAVTMPCAYALSRKDFEGRKLILALFMVTMYVGGGLVPGYLNMYNLGLLDTRWGIILSALCSTYNIIVARTFFNSTIPDELLEAARMDGCGNGMFFLKVVMPLSKPITAVLALYVGVARWNSYFSEMIYLRDPDKSPLTLVLRRLLWSIKEMQQLIDEGLMENIPDALAQIRLATTMQYALIVVSTLPMMIIYPFIQKYFAKGVMIGSVKG